jgi:hypothetical protein
MHIIYVGIDPYSVMTPTNLLVVAVYYRKYCL